MTTGAERGRCPTHDLALGPTGECVLCRRTLAPASPARGFPFVPLLVGSLALVVVAAGVSRWARTPTTSEVPPPPPSVAPEPIAAPSRPAPPSGSRLRSSAGVLDRGHDDEAAAAPSATAPEPPAAPSDAALAAARRRVSITMYSTTWCGVCARARAYLAEHHVAYTEHDVEASDRYRRAMHQINPRGGVPTFDIDGRVLVGFGPDSFEQIVDDAARERVRR